MASQAPQNPLMLRKDRAWRGPVSKHAPVLRDASSTGSAAPQDKREGAGYGTRRDALETYFDRTARKAWEDLTSDAKVSGIRATVRAGRAAMRALLLDWLPQDLRRTRILDAGCGTGAFAVEAARRGASVVAIDVAGGLVEVARARAQVFLGHGEIEWRVGDMLDPALGRFDHVVAMDSLIHYEAEDIARAVAGLRARATKSVLFTFAPRTPMLAAMHAAGKLFPRRDRAPAIVPVAEERLTDLIGADRIVGTERVATRFYISQAMEVRAS